MPIYEYECGKCGVFEHSQRISEPALAKCPTCRRKVRRLISSTSFQLKGTGWYVTDYARNGGQKDGKDDGKDGGKDRGKDGEAAKSESKSDTASTSTTSESSSTKSEKSQKSKKSDTKAGANTPAKTAS